MTISQYLINFQKVNFYPSNATNQEIIWSSSNPEVVAVASNKMNPLSYGTATITATTVDGNYSASYEVEVVGYPYVTVNIFEGYDVFQPVISFGIIILSNQNFAYTSSNRFVLECKFYRDNILLDGVKLHSKKDYTFLEHYKLSGCIDGEYHVEYTGLDKATGYKTSGKSLTKKIKCSS